MGTQVRPPFYLPENGK